MAAGWTATTFGAVLVVGLEHLTALWFEPRTGLEESSDCPDKPQVSNVAIVGDVEVAAFVGVEVGAEVEVDVVEVGEGAVVVAFEVVAAAVAAVAVEVYPSGLHDSEQIPMQNWPNLPLHQSQQKL